MKILVGYKELYEKTRLIVSTTHSGWNKKVHTIIFLLKSRKMLSVLLFFAFFSILIVHLLFYQPRILGILVYIKQNTNNDGSFAYTYYPKSDTAGYEYNLTRHSALLYALMDYLTTNTTLARWFYTDITNSLDYAIGFKKPCYLNSEHDYTCLMLENEPPMIGVNAVTILALTQAIKLYPSDQYIITEYMNEAIELEKFLSASFKDGLLVFGDYSTEKGERYESGQTLMAWVSLYNVTQNEEYLQKAKQLQDGILKKELGKNTYLLHHWFWLGMRDYYRTTGGSPSDQELEYIYKVGRHIVDLQTKEAGILFGTFNRVDPSLSPYDDQYDQNDPTSISVRVEGMGALLDLLTFAASKNSSEANEIAEELQDAIKRSIIAIDQNQILLKNILVDGYSLKSYGGLHRNDRSSSIQIDYLQHPLTAYKFFNGLKHFD